MSPKRGPWLRTSQPPAAPRPLPGPPRRKQPPPRPAPVDHRLERARKIAAAAGQRLELWTGDGRTPQRFTCPDHPGRALTMPELRALEPDPDAYRYALPAPPRGGRGETP